MPERADSGSWRRLSALAQRACHAPAGERDARMRELLDAIAHLAGPGGSLQEDARYRGMVERSPDPMAVYAEGQLLYVNEAAARALGAASPAQLIGRPLSDIVSPDYLEIIPARVAEMERTGEPAPLIRGEFRRLDGAWLVGEISSTPTVFEGRPAVQVVIRDVTEQAVAEAALRRREQEFEALVENAPDVIARFDPDHVVTYVNRAVERYTGFTPAQVVGSRLGRAISAEGLARVNGALSAVFNDRRSVSTELEVEGPHGRVLFEFRVLPQLGPDGKVESALVVGRDLQELRRTELALRRSEATLRGILNGAAIGISHVRPDGTFQGANPAFERMLGYGDGEITGKHFRDVTHPDDLARTQEMHDRLFQTGVGFVVEKRYLRRDGSTFWARLTPSLIRMPDGECYGVGMVEDITQAKAAQEALRASEARFRSLIENAADLIAILTSEGRVLYQSPSIEAVLGVTAEDVMGMDLTELVHPEDRAMVRARLGDLAAMPGVVASAEFRMRHADGSWRALASIAQNRLDDPAVGGIVVNTRDLTAARELQAQLLQSQKMEAVGRLAGGIAHDFNNILTAVQGHAGMLALELPQGSPHRADVEQIQRSVERAASLTRQLLAFSRHQVLQPKVLDLNTMVLETEKMLRRLIGEDVQLVTSLEPGLGRIKADPAQVQQVLLNLAVNARDAMTGGGRLSICTENAELDPGYAGDFPYEVVPG
ncbi:MAG TPA: PAS domain S-box protein, partial [Longimicrobiales bacterium]